MASQDLIEELMGAVVAVDFVLKTGFSPQLLAHHVRSGRYEHIRRGC